MALKGVLRPGYIQIRVTDLDKALKHYVDRIGMSDEMILTGNYAVQVGFANNLRRQLPAVACDRIS